MKTFRLYLLLFFFASNIAQPACAQYKKLDKSLSKADAYYKAGSFSKALKALDKVRTGASRIPGQTNYMLACYVREARINLAMGMLDGFEKSLENALNTSKTVYGETSESYAGTMLDVAEIYNEYENFRAAREFSERAQELLTKTAQLKDALAARIALIRSEAMIGQGFANDALELLNGYEKYFASRAVDKETSVQDGQIKTTRLAESEIFARHNDYARLKILMGMAYAKKRTGISHWRRRRKPGPGSDFWRTG